MTKSNLAEDLVEPRKASIAWKKLCATLKEFGRQEQRYLFVKRCSENRLLFRSDRGCCDVMLAFQGTSVAIEMGEVRDSILFVKVRKNSVAYELDGTLYYTSTRLALKLFRQYSSANSAAKNTALAVKDLNPAGKRSTTGPIVRILRSSELAVATGASLADDRGKAGIYGAIYRRRRRQYGGLRTTQARRLTNLENENRTLKQLLAEFNYHFSFSRGNASSLAQNYSPKL
jgi:hypothetical protein